MVSVDPSHQRKGIGSSLLQYAAKKVCRMRVYACRTSTRLQADVAGGTIYLETHSDEFVSALSISLGLF